MSDHNLKIQEKEVEERKLLQGGDEDDVQDEEEQEEERVPVVSARSVKKELYVPYVFSRPAYYVKFWDYF